MIEFNGASFYANDTVLADLNAALTHHKVTGQNKAYAITLGDKVVEMRPNELLECLEAVMAARAAG